MIHQKPIADYNDIASLCNKARRFLRAVFRRTKKAWANESVA